MKTWKIEDVLVLVAKFWHWAVLSIILGGLIGWGLSVLKEDKFQAGVDLYVGLDAYRAPLDHYVAEVAQKPLFHHWDDYKNWQMGQLEAVALSDAVFQKTLDRLADGDPYWRNVSASDLRAMAKLSWRNAGLWHFNVTHQQKQYAEQAVIAWTDVVLDVTNDAIEHSMEVKTIDGRLYLVENQLLALEERQQMLGQIRQHLCAWVSRLNELEKDDVLDAKSRWEIDSYVTYGMSWDAGWYRLVNDFPVDGSPVSQYIPWINRVVSVIDVELADIPKQIESLEVERSSLEKTYEEEGKKGLGLSANLLVKRNEEGAVSTRNLRNEGYFILIGGLVGFVLWVIFLLVRIDQD